MVLSETNEKFELITSSSSSIDYNITYQAVNKSKRTNEGNIASATTSIIVNSPEKSEWITVLSMFFKNKGASSNTLTVQKDKGGSNYQIGSYKLLPGETLIYDQLNGFVIYDSKGLKKKSDKLSFDAFGLARVSEPGNLLDVEFTYDTLEEIVDEVISGAGVIAHQSNTRDVVLSAGGTGLSDYAGLYTYPVPYTPGNSQLIKITGVLDYADVGGGVAQLFLRSKISGSVTEEVYNQSDWEDPNLDMNWDLSHIFVMDFQSLKVGKIRYGFNRGGDPIYVHEIKNDNLRNSGYWQSPNLPVYWRIYNDATYTYMELGYGDTDNGIGFRYRVAKTILAEMKAICATVKSEGGDSLFDLKGYPVSADMAETPKTVSTTIIPLISIRMRSTFNSLPNNTIAIPNTLSVQTDNPIRLIAYHDATLTSPSWANVDTNHSVLERDISASALTGGHVIDSEYVATSKNINAAFNTLLGKSVLWYRKNGNTGIFTIAAVRTTSTNASVLCGIKLNEIR